MMIKVSTKEIATTVACIEMFCARPDNLLALVYVYRRAFTQGEATLVVRDFGTPPNEDAGFNVVQMLAGCLRECGKTATFAVLPRCPALVLVS